MSESFSENNPSHELNSPDAIPGAGIQFRWPAEKHSKGYAQLLCEHGYKKEGTMDTLAVIDLMSLLVVGLFVISVVTPSGVNARRSRRY